MIEKLSSGVVAGTLQVRRAVRSLQPRFVHAHSSWAGVFTRIAPEPPARVIYQPHGYAFEKPNRGLAWSFRVVEGLLAQRKQVVVVLSGRECVLAEGLSRKAETFFLPNIPTVPVRAEHGRNDCWRNDNRPLEIIMVGRIEAQKDPDFFARTIKATKERGLNCRGVWIGDGPAEKRAALEREGIEVTGWLGTNQLVGELDSADLYVHTGRYEGFPLSVLDAAARRRLVIVRDIPAFDGVEFPKASTPEDLAALIERTSLSSHYRAQIAMTGADLLERSSEAVLSERLKALYE